MPSRHDAACLAEPLEPRRLFADAAGFAARIDFTPVASAPGFVGDSVIDVADVGADSVGGDVNETALCAVDGVTVEGVAIEPVDKSSLKALF